MNEAADHSLNLDERKLDNLMREVRSRQSLGTALIGGTVGALVGAGLWALVTVITEYQIGYMAIGVGFLAGFGVRLLGQGIDTQFRIAGASLALIGCLIGNLVSVAWFLSRELQVPFTKVMANLDLGAIFTLMKATAHGMDVLFYGIALYVGWQFSLRPLTGEELESCMRDPEPEGDGGYSPSQPKEFSNPREYTKT